MALKNSRSQTEIIESSQIALQNAETNPKIKPLMEALGYTTAKIDEGRALVKAAKSLYDSNLDLEEQRANAYKAFENKRTEIDAIYAKDRKKAKIIFKNNEVVLNDLGLVGTVPKSYVKWLEKVTLFYATLNEQKALLKPLAVVQITPEYVNVQLALTTALATFRGAYTQAKGNAQNATKTKNKAFVALEKWMSDFYAMARIALEKEPQLLESLGKLVKS